MSARLRICAAAMMLSLMLGSCAVSSAEADTPELLRPVNAPVDVVTVTRGDVVQLKVFEGTVTARSEQLRFMASDAPIAAVYVSPGDYVTAGTLLAEMDKSGLNAQLEMNEAMLEFNEAMWANSNAQSEVAVARARDGGAEAFAAELQKRLDFDKATQKVERERLQFKIKTLQAMMPQYEITASFDGTVMHVADTSMTGGFIAPRGTLIWLADMTELTIQCSDAAMREALLTSRRVTADFGEGECAVELIPYTNQEITRFNIENRTPPSRFRLLEGTLSAECRVLLRVYGESRSNVLTLIPNAVHDDAVTVDGVTVHNRFVYADEGGVSVRREVKLGLSSDISVEILEGLREGESVYVQES